MSLMKSYLSVLNENKQNSGVAADNTGELDGAENAKKLAKDSGPESVKNLKKAENGPHSEDAEKAMPKKVNSESKNPFDLLYNKILAQEAFGEDDMEDLSDDSSESEDFSLNDDSEEIDDLGMSDEEGEEEESEELEGLDAVLDHLKSAVASLEALISSEEEEGEEEEGEGEEYGDEETEGAFELDFNPDESPVAKESVELKPLKKNAGEKLVKKTNQALKTAVAVAKKKAVATKGVKPEGKYVPCKANPEALTSKSKQNTGGVKVGKGLFEQ